MVTCYNGGLLYKTNHSIICVVNTYTQDEAVEIDTYMAINELKHRSGQTAPEFGHERQSLLSLFFFSRCSNKRYPDL